MFRCFDVSMFRCFGFVLLFSSVFYDGDLFDSVLLALVVFLYFSLDAGLFDTGLLTSSINNIVTFSLFFLNRIDRIYH